MTGAVAERWVIERYADLAAETRQRPARLGSVRLVAIDGPSGAGKTSFSARLAAALRASGTRTAIVHADDLLDGWADQFMFWPRLESTVLEPLRLDMPAEHPVYDWMAGRFVGSRKVSVPDVLILEGVTSARKEVRPELTTSVFVTAARDVRLARCLTRDGAEVEGPLLRWMAAEEEYFVRDRTPERVDRLVDGAPAMRHDPESEYVRRGSEHV